MKYIEFEDKFEELDAFDEEELSEEELDKLYRRKQTNSRKDLLPLFVYKILTEETDRSRHVTQKELARRLGEYPYEISVERKALGRCLHSLADTGFGIRCDQKKGCWFDKEAIWD